MLYLSISVVYKGAEAEEDEFDMTKFVLHDCVGWHLTVVVGTNIASLTFRFTCCMTIPSTPQVERKNYYMEFNMEFKVTMNNLSYLRIQ